MIFLKIHGLGVKSYTLLLETYDFTPYDFTPTNIFFFFFDVKTMHEVHFQSILFHSHISCKGLKSLLNPLPNSSGHIHGDDTLFHTAKKFHRTLIKSFFLPCKQTSGDRGAQNGNSVDIDHLFFPTSDVMLQLQVKFLQRLYGFTPCTTSPHITLLS